METQRIVAVFSVRFTGRFLFVERPSTLNELMILRLETSMRRMHPILGQRGGMMGIDLPEVSFFSFFFFVYITDFFFSLFFYALYMLKNIIFLLKRKHISGCLISRKHLPC